MARAGRVYSRRVRHVPAPTAGTSGEPTVIARPFASGTEPAADARYDELHATEEAERDSGADPDPVPVDDQAGMASTADAPAEDPTVAPTTRRRRTTATTTEGDGA